MAKKTKNKITNSLNWRTVTFGNETLFSVVLGGTPSSKTSSYWNGEVVWITPNDLSSNEKVYILDSERKISKEGLKRSNSSLVPEDSIILSTRAPIGYSAITAKPMAFNQGCKAIVVKDKNKISSEFLYYYLLTKVSLMKAWGSGSTFRELATDDLKSLKIILPDIKVQNKIVLVLNRIRQQINTQKELIENLKELKSALLEKLFTEGVIKGFMFDTNIFGRIIDNKIKLKDLPKNKNYFVTHIQQDELNRTKNKQRKRELLKIFTSIDKNKVPTESAVFGVSKFDYCKFSKSILFEKIKQEIRKLDRKQGKKSTLKNLSRDALISETAIKQGLILVSDDENLRIATEKFGGEAISLKSFINRNFRELKETEIGKIPKSWKVVRLGDYVYKPEYGYTASAVKTSIGPKILRITDIQRDKVDWQTVPYCKCSASNEKKYLLKKGDILITRIGATTGKAFLVTNAPRAVFASYLIRIRANKLKLNFEFLNYFLRTNSCWHQINQQKGGKLKTGINIPILKSLLLPLTSLREQKQIIEYLKRVDQKIEHEEKKLKLYEELFQTTLHKLMSFEIDVSKLKIN